MAEQDTTPGYSPPGNSQMRLNPDLLPKEEIESCKPVSRTEFEDYKKFLGNIQHQTGTYNKDEVDVLQKGINSAATQVCDTNEFVERLWCAYKKKHLELMKVMNLIDGVQPIVYRFMKDLERAQTIYVPIKGRDAVTPHPQFFPVPQRQAPSERRGSVAPSEPGAVPDQPSQDSGEYLYVESESGPKDGGYMELPSGGAPKVDNYKPVVDYLLKLIYNQYQRNNPRKNILKELKQDQNELLKSLEKDKEFLDVLNDTKDKEYRNTVMDKYGDVLTDKGKKNNINAFLQYGDAERYNKLGNILGAKLGGLPNLAADNTFNFDDSNQLNDTNIQTLADNVKGNQAIQTSLGGAILGSPKDNLNGVNNNDVISQDQLNDFKSILSDEQKQKYQSVVTKETLEGPITMDKINGIVLPPNSQSVSGGFKKTKKSQNTSNTSRTRINRFRNILNKRGKLNITSSNRLNRFLK